MDELQLIKCMKYGSINHSKFKLNYHFIFVCKHRKKLLLKYGKEIKLIMNNISQNYDFDILYQETDKDHLHLLIDSVPKLSPLMIVRVLKQQSTFEIYKKYKLELKKLFWKENTFWTDGYFCFTIGNIGFEILKTYIENQG